MSRLAENEVASQTDGASVGGDAQQFQALVAEAEQMRNQLELVSRQMDALSNLKADKSRARETLQGIMKAKPGDEVLFPVGGNTFVSATLGENAEVIKGIGSEYAMPRAIEKAVEELGSELESLDRDLGALTNNAGQLESRIMQIEDYLRAATGQSG